MSHSLRTYNLFKLSWPILLQNLTFTVVLLVDFWFFSYLSDTTAAVVGQLQPVVWLGAFLIPTFAGTGIAVASQFIGAKQDKKVIPTYMTNILFSLIMGIVMGGGLMIFSDQIGLWMNMSLKLNDISHRYLMLIGFYFIVLALGVAYNAILSSRGMTQWLMWSAFVINGLNLILDAVLILIFGMDLEGVVLATISAQLTGLLLVMVLVHIKLGIRFYLKGAWTDMRGVLAPMLKIGIPNALEPFSYSVQQIFLSALIINMGLVSMAANSYALRLINPAISVAWSLAHGGQILLAHYMGAQQYQKVNRNFWIMIATTMLASSLSAILLWQFSDQFFGIFTNNAQVILVGKTLMLITLFMEPARAINIAAGVALRAVGDTNFPLITSMIFIWGILPIIYFLDLSFTLTIFTMWLCFAADEILRSAINLWRWTTGRWKAMGLTSKEAEY